MNDSSQGRAELQALLRSLGPTKVFTHIGELCADEVRHQTSDETIELWELAADAAQDAVASLTGEDDDAENGDDTDDDDAEDGDDTDDDDDDAEDGDDTDDDDARKQAPDGNSEEADTSHANEKAANAANEGTATLMKDTRLGVRPKNATLWRCFRVVEGKWIPLFHGERGIQVIEWPIKQCSADVIADRWGDGAYVVQYVTLAEGRRRPCGRSVVIQVEGRSQPIGGDEEPNVEAPASPRTPPAPPLGRIAPSVGAHQPLFSPTTPSSPSSPMTDAWAMMAWMRETEERAQARAEKRAQIEMDRYRIDKEAELERERLMSVERLKQMELQQRVPRGGRDSVDVDAKLASVLSPIVHEISTLSRRVEEALGEIDDDDDSDAIVEAPPPPDPWTKALETFGPIVEHLVSRLSPDPATIAIPHVPLPPSDPAKKPN